MTTVDKKRPSRRGLVGQVDVARLHANGKPLLCAANTACLHFIRPRKAPGKR